MTAVSARVKKIVIIRNAYAYDFGGGERMPVNLAATLIDNGWQSVIISRSEKLLNYAQSRNVPALRGWWWSRQNWSGARVVLTPIYFLWQIIMTIWYLALFVKLRPDIVHAQSKDDFIAATIAAKLLRKDVVWSDHADLKYVYLNLPVWYKNPIGKVVKFVSRWAGKIILTSQSDKTQIEQALGAKLGKKYTIIYNGISDQPALTGERHPGSKVIFAATSRLVTAKGIGELISAFLIVSQKYKSELWLLGEGPEEAKFKMLAGENSNIKFLGWPDNALEKAAKADIFVHPSYLEGFSLSLVEAAMLAKPIIACSVGGNTELVIEGKNGLLIPPRDTAALAQAMLRLASDKSLRQNLGQAGRKVYEQKFVFEKIVKDQYIPLYEKI